MKTPVPNRELRLHRRGGLVELVKAPRSNRGGAGASTKWLRRDGVMERSRGLRGASVVARGATMVAAEPWRHRQFLNDPTVSATLLYRYVQQ